jgi:hypothetical protein
MTQEKKPSDQPAAPIEWPKPVPLEKPNDRELFPIETLPLWLKNFVVALAEEIQVPVDLLGTIVVALLGAAIARRVRVRIRGKGWEQPSNIYVVGVLEVSERKSPPFAEALAPVFAVERALRAQVQADEVALRAKLKEAESKIESTDSDEDQKHVEEEAFKAALALAAMDGQPQPRLTTSGDTTREKLASLLADHGGRILVARAEGDLFEVVAGRFGGKASPGPYLQGYSGDRIVIDRKSRPTEIIESPAISVAVTVQPSVLRTIGAIPVLAERGFLARFLYCCPREQVGSRKSRPELAKPSVRQRYDDVMQRVWRDGAVLPATEEVIELDHDAHEEITKFHEDVERCLARGGDLRDMFGWGGKLVSAAARLALALHVGSRLDAGAEPYIGGQIGLATMKDAIKLGKYFASHAKVAFGVMENDRLFVGANRILDWLGEMKLGYFSHRECWRKTRSFFKTANLCKDALALLEEHGYIREHAPVSGGRRVGYLVSPLLSTPPGSKNGAGHEGHNAAKASATEGSSKDATVASTGPPNGQAAAAPSTPGAIEHLSVST